MSWELSQEVTLYLSAHAEGITPAERVALYAIAERASAGGPHARLAWDGPDWDLETIVGAGRIRQVLGRLGTRGLECRVQHGVSSTGKPIYAHRGKAVTYLLPNLDAQNQKGASVEAGPALVDAPLSEKGASTESEGASVKPGPASTSAPSPSVLLPVLPPSLVAAQVPPARAGTDRGGEIISEALGRWPALRLAIGTADLGPAKAACRTALDAGVTPTQILDSIAARSLEGAMAPVAALTARIRSLSPPPPQTAIIRCPLHAGQPAYRCSCCSGEVAEGFDPYAGRERLRPSGWLSHYPRAARLVAAA